MLMNSTRTMTMQYLWRNQVLKDSSSRLPTIWKWVPMSGDTLSFNHSIVRYWVHRMIYHQMIMPHHLRAWGCHQIRVARHRGLSVNQRWLGNNLQHLRAKPNYRKWLKPQVVTRDWSLLCSLITLILLGDSETSFSLGLSLPEASLVALCLRS